MGNFKKTVREYTRDHFKGWSRIKLPNWIESERWRPSQLLAQSGSLLAVDEIPSASLPAFQYARILELRREHPELSLLIVTNEERLQDNGNTREFCTKHEIGLKAIDEDMSVITYVSCAADPPVPQSTLTQETGWFPKEILDRAYGLQNISFADDINEFIDELPTIPSEKDATLELVTRTIDGLLAKHPGFKGNLNQFMKLAHFETLLEISQGSTSDHIFHSFRVFLAGCPVIDSSYKHFAEAHKHISMGVSKVRVEYVWLLTAIFHDIGRRKEKLPELLSMQMDDDDDYSVAVGTAKWSRSNYQTANRVLGSLSTFLTSGLNVPWDGGVVADADAIKLSDDWISIYSCLESHSVISALDFLADLLEKIEAADKRPLRASAIAYAVPAALSILLHDWHIWEKYARGWKLFPIDGSVIPLAALLIYIDTWDDFRRRGNEQLVYIREYLIDKRGAAVWVEWENPQKLADERLKYESYEKALENLKFKLDITRTTASGN